MKARMIAATLMLCLAGAVVCLAADMSLGTWKLNENKSKFSPGAPKTTISMYEASGDDIKVTLDGTGFDGQPSHTEWTGKFDGKDYPISGSSTQTSRSYVKVNAHTLRIKVKNGDQVILQGIIVTSADGMTRTVKASGTSADGKKFSYTAVYDKQ
jgi:uncharacterized protein YdeI (BOF family)